VISLQKNSKSSPKAIVDTSTFFSALYNRKGNEAYLFEMANVGKCSIYILDYVLDEMKEIFERKDIDFELVLDLLENYDNIKIKDLDDLSDDEIQLAKVVITDPKDRPVFVFSKRMIDQSDTTYLISGDQGFFKKRVLKELNHQVLNTREFIKLMDQ